MAQVSKESLHMQLSDGLIRAAQECADKAEADNLPLPAEIPGHPGLFIAHPNEAAIITIAAIRSTAGTTYKIGTKNDAEATQ